ncbi:MAG TPA: M28 family peptidase, partial [Kofleriaceae bacterium]|nr:M28 family peptidase [Kofleriaceae bacterium]
MTAARTARAASAALAVSAALLLAACSAGSPGPGPGIDVDRALGHTAALVALGPRPGDSPAAARAADHIARSLEELGLTVARAPVGTVDLPGIRALGRTFRKPRTAVTRDPNLVVRIGGPGPALLVLAHYDTVGKSPGAIDNAVAAGVLIELARALRDAPPPAPVVLAFPANEEIGLVGSEALAASLAAGPAGPAGDVAFAIALDLVGGSGPLSLNGAGTQIRQRELRWLAAAAGRAGTTLRAPLPHRVISRWWPQLERSDHGPFTRRGIRAVHLYHRGQDGEHIDLAYHSARDTLARVDRGAVDELGRVLRALAASPPPAPDGGGPDGFWVPVARNTVVPRAALLALALVLAGTAL